MASISKNFVVKHGLDVALDATIAGSLTTGLITTTGVGGAAAIQPFANNNGTIGTAALRYNNAHFTNATVYGTLSVRTSLDFADGDFLQFGSSDDARLSYIGGTNVYNQQLRGSSVKYNITDTGGVELFAVYRVGGLVDIINSAQVGGSLTVNGGDIILGGTGRIQGIDVVTDPTDAVNKEYVDLIVPVTISPNEPLNPLEGDLWWDSDVGVLFIYYNDGNSVQWVEASPSNSPLIFNGTDTYSLDFNLAVNGNASFSGDVTISGDLVVNGTTTTLNTQITTLNDPVLTLANNTSVDDNKDRGVEFKWHDGVGIKTGFFGFDDSTGYFTFRPDATNTSEVFAGALGDIEAANFRGNLIGTSATVDSVVLASGSVSAPSLAFSGDLNTGLYRITGDRIGVTAGGVLGLSVSSTAVSVEHETTFTSGSIILGGTGRIQGIDSVIDNTDAVNKIYVDNAVAAGGGFTQEEIEDFVGAMVTGNVENGISVTYDDVNGKLDFDVDDFTITLGGDLTGNVTITNLASATLTATIAPNSVELGTDTTGNYVATGATAGNGISGSATGEGSTFTVTSNATDANTPSTIVFRDASGNFSAGTITASLNGNATSANTATTANTADTATNVTTVADNATNTTRYLTFVQSNAASDQPIRTDNSLTYNPSQNTLTTTTLNTTTVTTGSASVSLFNTTATTVNAFQAATNLTIGATTGTTTIRNASVVLSGDLAVNGGDITTTAASITVFNSTATGVNAFGAATSLVIGATTGTTNIRNASVILSGDLTVNGGNITLGGTGRIQGIDTVSAATDAASKGYVDTAVAAAGITIVNDTTTNATRYITFSDQTSGSENTLNVASTKLTFNPSTGQVDATNFNSTSDANLKTDIETASGMEVVSQLRGVEFNWKGFGEKSSGVIAQEVEAVIPHVVSENINGKSVNYSAIIAYLIEGMKEQQAQIDNLKTEIYKLKSNGEI